MKRTILFLILPALLLASCGKDDALDPGTQPAEQIRFEIGFAPTGGLQTRAATDANFKTTWETDDAVGLFIVKGGGSLQASGNWVDNLGMTYNGSTWSYTLPSGKEYYPNDGDKLHFYAYYPYDAGATNLLAYTFSVKADQRAEADYNRSDLLLATAANQSRGNAVSLQFSHALALVQVEVKREVYVPLFDDANFTVTLTGAKPNATLNWSTPLTGTGSVVDIVMHKVAGMDYTYRTLVPAQTLAADSKVAFVQTTGKEINMEYRDVSSAPLAASKAHKYSVTLGWGIDPDPDHVYAVGDVYPHVGPAIGIVYLIENGGKNGKVVGLEENSGVQWSSFFSNPRAADTNNGRVNMHTIYDRNNAFADYPAFAWVHAMNGGGTTDYYSDATATNVWYLPASEELRGDLYRAYNANRTVFNSKLTAAGGTGFSDNSYYWSSSENDYNYAWFVDFGYYGFTNSNYKTDSYRARCVLAF